MVGVVIVLRADTGLRANNQRGTGRNLWLRQPLMIRAGEVFSGDTRIEKAGQTLPCDAPLRVRNVHKYVSRGGLKLEGALADSGFDPSGLVAADIGASTGGFTDCLLQNGAKRVFAVDVGHAQLAEKLRQDPRV